MRKYKWFGKSNIQLENSVRHNVIVKPDASMSDLDFGSEGYKLLVRVDESYFAKINGLYVYALERRHLACCFGTVLFNGLRGKDATNALYDVDYQSGDIVVFSSGLMDNTRYVYQDDDLLKSLGMYKEGCANMILEISLYEVYARSRDGKTVGMNGNVIVKPIYERPFYNYTSNGIITDIDTVNSLFGHAEVFAPSADYDGLDVGDIVVAKQDFYGAREWKMANSYKSANSEKCHYLGERIWLPESLFGGNEAVFDQFAKVKLDHLIAKCDKEGVPTPLHEMVLVKLDKRKEQYDSGLFMPFEYQEVSYTGTVVAQGDCVEHSFVDGRVILPKERHDKAYYLRDYSRFTGDDYVIVYSYNHVNSGYYAKALIGVC